MKKAEYEKYLRSEHWQSRRYDALLRAQFQCEGCGMPDYLAKAAYFQDLNVHHRTYSRLGKELDGDLSVLCKRCHQIEEFGASKLRQLETIKCVCCGHDHWNISFDLCDECRMLTTSEGDSRLFDRLGLHDPVNGAEIWMRVFEVLGLHLEAINR